MRSKKMRRNKQLRRGLRLRTYSIARQLGLLALCLAVGADYPGQDEPSKHHSSLTTGLTGHPKQIENYRGSTNAYEASLLLVVVYRKTESKIVYLDHVHWMDEHPRRDSARASDAEAHGRRNPLGGIGRRFGSHGQSCVVRYTSACARLCVLVFFRVFGFPRV